MNTTHRTMRLATALLAAAAFALLSIGAESCETDSGGGEETTATDSSGGSVHDRVRASLQDAEGSVEDPEIKEVDFVGDVVNVTAATPEGGFEGASTQDIDWQAQAIFTAIYDDTGFDGGAQVLLTGGRVDAETGEDLPDAKTGSYEMTPAQAKKIDWGDGDALDSIDWSLYRTFASPALKQS